VIATSKKYHNSKNLQQFFATNPLNIFYDLEYFSNEVVGGQTFVSVLDVTLIFRNPTIYPHPFSVPVPYYYNKTYSQIVDKAIEPLNDTSSVLLKFEFQNTQYNSYLYEAEPFLTSLQKIGAFLALFKLGGLFEICHRRKHERRLTKRFLRKLDKQKQEEQKLTTMPAASPQTPDEGTPGHI